MKYKALFIAFFMLIAVFTKAQENSENVQTNQYSNKGKLYVYWGWNKSAYSNSDIYFKGNNYDFTIHNVVGVDRQSPISSDYINPKSITIPQYNFRIGYYFNDKYSISIGNDHMKYVMKNGQRKQIDGYIKNSGGKYDKVYEYEEIELSQDFLMFEHTDGLNYENIDIRRHERIKQFSNFTVDAFVGLGAGISFPRTNVTFLEGKRYDEFNVAGYGVNALLGGNLTYKGWLFVQVETKGGYIDMPNIRVSYDKSEYAQQHFSFFQYNIVFGANIKLTKMAN